MTHCPTCQTPLDEHGECVTCGAAAEGLVLLARQEFAQVREVMGALELAGLAPEMERVPASCAAEKARPRWNLYVPKDEVERAQEVLSRDWAALLEDEAALEAARRGAEGVELAAGAVVCCPACAAQFTVPSAGEVECPECGLGLGPAGAGEA